ncbi:MAG: amidotransferase [Pseudomonadota bacterium]
MTVRLHYFQHVPFEGLGSIADWCRERAIPVTVTRFYAGDPVPEPAAYDFLVVMGGPMSVNDGLQYAWLDAEINHITAAVKQGKTVLGICLGAQLIAAAAGARVYPNRQKEIGWFPVVRTTSATASGPLAGILPAEVLAFHWHGETFDLPEGAAHLARSAACEHQAFALGQRVIGLQFHLETTRASATALLNHCGADITDAPAIQEPSEILSDETRFADINRVMVHLLDRLCPSPG